MGLQTMFPVIFRYSHHYGECTTDTFTNVNVIHHTSGMQEYYQDKTGNFVLEKKTNECPL